jgi:hypothetical protein
MESGWVADRSHAGLMQQSWSAGAPQPSFWTGLKLEKDRVVPITTLRCPNCGYLESYAIAQNENGVMIAGSGSSQPRLVALVMALVALAMAFGAALLIRAR